MSNFNSATVRGAWHDATCPAGPECSDRSMHAMSLDYMVAPLDRFLTALPSPTLDDPGQSATITIPRPHVPFGPKGVTAEKADADYLRSAVGNIEFSVERGRALWGSNLTATIIKLLRDAADAIETQVQP